MTFGLFLQSQVLRFVSKGFSGSTPPIDGAMAHGRNTFSAKGVQANTETGHFSRQRSYAFRSREKRSVSIRARTTRKTTKGLDTMSGTDKHDEIMRIKRIRDGFSGPGGSWNDGCEHERYPGVFLFFAFSFTYSECSCCSY